MSPRDPSPRTTPPFRFLNSVASGTAKLSMPGPGMAHLPGGRNAVSRDVSPDMDAFWDGLIAAYGADLAALADAGCRYLQFDDVSFGYLCDDDFRAGGGGGFG